MVEGHRRPAVAMCPRWKRWPPVGEDKQRTAARVFTQSFGDHRVQAVEALSKITRFNGQEHLERAGEAQHDEPEACSDFNKAQASGTCRTSESSMRAPPGSWTTRTALEASPIFGSTTASINRSGARPLEGEFAREDL
jgi:hypothetical protein